MVSLKTIERELEALRDHAWPILIVFVAAGFVFFYGLSYPPICMWDESRLAVNALEMLDNRQWFVTYFNGEPDMWNTKPPLMIWLITFFMALLGPDTLALRLPSAIAGIATVGVILLFCAYHLKSIPAGLLSALVLITSSGYVMEHVTRTGDYDALLVLWITIYSLALLVHFNHVIHRETKTAFLWIAGVAFVLAVWTKGLAGILALPGIFLYIAIHPKLIARVFRNPQSYYVLLFCALFSLLPYLIRDIQNPGYIQAVMENEIFGRYGEALEDHSASPSFYVAGLLQKYLPWIYLWLPCSIVVATSKNALLRNYGKFSFLYLLSYMSIISSAKTKLPWYDAPFYPIAAIVIGLGIYQAYNILSHYWLEQERIRPSLGKALKVCLIGLSLILLFLIPYTSVAYKHIYKNYGLYYSWSDLSEPSLQYGNYFKEFFQANPTIKEFTTPIRVNDYNAHLIFYAKVYNREGYNIRVEQYKVEKLAGSVVVTCDSKIHDDIIQKKAVEPFHHNDSCFAFRIE